MKISQAQHEIRGIKVLPPWTDSQLKRKLKGRLRLPGFAAGSLLAPQALTNHIK